MAKNNRNKWDEDYEDSRIQRAGRKFRWHKLSVSLGRSRKARRNEPIDL